MSFEGLNVIEPTLKIWDALQLVSRNNNDTITEQAGTIAQETLEFKLITSMDTFPLNPRLELEKNEYGIAATNLLFSY